MRSRFKTVRIGIPELHFIADKTWCNCLICVKLLISDIYNHTSHITSCTRLLLCLLSVSSPRKSENSAGLPWNQISIMEKWHNYNIPWVSYDYKPSNIHYSYVDFFFFLNNKYVKKIIGCPLHTCREVYTEQVPRSCRGNKYVLFHCIHCVLFLFHLFL